MADTLVASFGPPHQSFHYCGDVVATDNGLDGIADFEVIRYWTETGDSVEINVVAWCDDGDPGDQFVWVSEPGGTHITHFGDHTDEGNASYTAVDDSYDQVRIGMHGFGQVMHYCYTVIVNDMPVPAASTCKVWGDWAGDGEEWWAGDGATIAPSIIIPPETDSFRYSGGSDGTSNYLLSLDDTYPNQFWVSKFNAMFTTRLDRWEVTGWTGNPVGLSDKFWDAFSDNQQLCADATRVVVIAYAEDRPGAFYEPVAFEVTVFDLTGTIVDQWSIADSRQISGWSGSCLDADSVFFGVYDSNTSDESVAKINLSTGVLTDLFLIADVDAAITALDGTWGGLLYTAGIVEVDGDLIINGSTGIARIQQDGTPVWWAPIIDSGAEYRGLAKSGRGSVWACDSNGGADEYREDGSWAQTIALPEPASQAWLGSCSSRRGGWTFGTRVG